MNEGIASSILMCGLLLAASAILMRSHRRTWRLHQSDISAEPRELDYRRRRFRRRMQSSAMLGILGLAILAGHFIRPPLPVLAVLIYWACVILLVFWLMLLAMADIISTRLHFGQLRRHYQSEQTRLHAQIGRMTKAAGNGKPGRDV
jgi:hypothetical protein